MPVASLAQGDVFRLPTERPALKIVDNLVPYYLFPLLCYLVELAEFADCLDLVLVLAYLQLQWWLVYSRAHFNLKSHYQWLTGGEYDWVLGCGGVGCWADWSAMLVIFPAFIGWQTFLSLDVVEESADPIILMAIFRGSVASSSCRGWSLRLLWLSLLPLWLRLICLTSRGRHQILVKARLFCITTSSPSYASRWQLSLICDSVKIAGRLLLVLCIHYLLLLLLAGKEGAFEGLLLLLLLWVLLISLEYSALLATALETVCRCLKVPAYLFTVLISLLAPHLLVIWEVFIISIIMDTATTSSSELSEHGDQIYDLLDAHQGGRCCLEIQQTSSRQPMLDLLHPLEILLLSEFLICFDLSVKTPKLSIEDFSTHRLNQV